MKSLLVKLGVILVLVIIFCPCNSFAEIEINRFKNKTVVRTKPGTARGTEKQPALVLFGIYDGQTPTRPGEVYSIEFVLESPSWAYLHCHSVDCLADGSPVQLPPSEHRGTVGKGYVIEHISIMVPFSIVERLSKSEKVEFKLCATEFTLGKSEMEDLRTFVEAFTDTEAWGAEGTWVLWKSTTINVDETSKRWEIIIAVPTYEQCSIIKKDLIQKELEVYRKFFKSADVTSPDHVLAVMREGVINTLDYYCFPDTIDPRK